MIRLTFSLSPQRPAHIRNYRQSSQIPLLQVSVRLSMQTVILNQGRLAGAPGRPEHAAMLPLHMNEPELCDKIQSLFVASFSGPNQDLVVVIWAGGVGIVVLLTTNYYYTRFSSLSCIYDASYLRGTES